MGLQCIDGQWKPSQQGLQIIPDCEAICDPPCLNGGNCLSYNVCQCPKEFRGGQCQWGTERCATTKMNFNGGFQCTGSADYLSCKITCPKGISFDFQPADVYTCHYETAEFVPKQVPRCVYGKNSLKLPILKISTNLFSQLLECKWFTPNRKHHSVKQMEPSSKQAVVRGSFKLNQTVMKMKSRKLKRSSRRRSERRRRRSTW